jgi:GR25 family glycosyltransferase involved in LPS biosynthesis
VKKIFLLFLAACSTSTETAPKPEIYSIVYVINLDRTPERFQKTNEQLHKNGMTCRRFGAVDGYNVKLSDKSSGEIICGKEFLKNVANYTWKKRPALYHVDYNNKYKDAEFDLFVKYRKFSAGEIGVIFSHRAIWTDIVKNNYQNVIIFEDDVILLENFKKDLEELIKNIPEDTDVTFIGVGRRTEKKIDYPDINNIFRDFDHIPENNTVAKIQPTNLVFGMHAYIIGAEGAKKLLKLTNGCTYPLDDIVFQQGGVNEGTVKVCVAKKKMCYPNFKISEIKKMGRSF